MATFEEALPGLQAQGYGNVMDALAAYNQAQQQSYFAPAATPATASQNVSSLTAQPSTATAGITSLPGATDYSSLVSKAYQDVLGRPVGATDPGLAYYTGQLQSGALTSDKLAQALAYGAQGMDRPAAQTYLGKDIWGPTEFLKGTQGAGYQDIIDFVNQNISDPYKIYQAATTYGVDPNEILQAYQSKGTSPYSLQQIQDYLSTGKTGFENKFQGVLGSVLGTPEEQTQLNTFLQTQYKNPSLSISSLFDPTDYVSKSFEDIQSNVKGSAVNKLQEALRLSKVAKNVLGYTDTDANALVGKAISGKLTSREKEIYDTLLEENELKGEKYNDLMSYAAVNSPTAKVFQDNPDLLKVYTPLQSKTGETGQYDYYKNAPILNAKWVDDYLDDATSKKLDLGADNELGWATNSRYQGSIKQGVGLVGIDLTKNELDNIKKADDYLAKQGGLKTQQYFDYESGTPVIRYGVLRTDPESGQQYLQDVDAMGSQFGLDSESGQKTYSQVKSNLDKGAIQLGIDPTKYENLIDLYNAIEDKTKNLYAVTGRTATWDPNIASNVGTNHATVVYQKVGDKLVPLSQPQGFNFNDPKKSGFQAQIQKLGPILPMAMMALSAATGGISSLLAPYTAPLVASLEAAGLPSILANATVNAMASSALSGATGGDWKKAGLSSLVSGAIGGGMSTTQNPDFPETYSRGFAPGYGQQFLDALGYNSTDLAGLVSPNTLARLGGTYLGATAAGLDPGKVLVNQAISQGFRSLPGRSAFPGGSAQSNFSEDLEPKFPATQEQKTALEDEYRKDMAGGMTEPLGITGLPLSKEDAIIAATKEIVPLLMTKGLSRADATLLASNLVGASLPA